MNIIIINHIHVSISIFSVKNDCFSKSFGKFAHSKYDQFFKFVCLLNHSLKKVFSIISLNDQSRSLIIRFFSKSQKDSILSKKICSFAKILFSYNKLCMFTKTMLISSFNNFIQDEDFICTSVPGSMFCGSNLRKEILNTNPGRSLKNFSYIKTQKSNMQLKYHNLFYLFAPLKKKTV